MTAALSMIVAVVIAFVFGWKLAFVISALMPVMIIATFLDCRQRMTRQFRDAQLLEEAGRILNECTENIRTVKSLCQEQHFYDQFKQCLLVPYRESLRQGQIYAGSYSISQSFIFLIYAAAFRYGGYLVSVGEMDPLQACSCIPDMVKALISGSLTFHMIGMEPDIDNCSQAGLKPDLKGKICFNNVYFNYPTRKSVQVLRGIAFKTTKRMTLAVVGPSGCGKTTLVNLIERYYDPVIGNVTAEGFDVRTINIRHWRDSIGLVSQEPVLFNCSMHNNITYGIDHGATRDRVVAAAKIANIHDFILTLPNGYNTLAGEKGVQLSGGQKQRIAIARALIRNPKLLLLDEATSALDTENEQMVQDAIEKATTGRISILIAHRLSTVQNADWIIVLKEGRIAEEGKHNQLMNRKGIYYRMIKMQDLTSQ
ncbi:unnamed protein product [Soboliphyme baturini]|uniref:ABC-type xenobiotic transporter n=1 Tax=Soboliphyme baturini TaxID=241478 RepID=A0A183IH46_9BILA|nr:unnamed protein product [Soboliphyme baturini]